jgi:release factor glutamine methyltransferase
MPALNVSEAIRHGAKLLGGTPSTTPRLDSELLLGHVLGLSRTQLLASPDLPLSGPHVAALEALLTRRAGGEPVAYLTGRREFRNLTLAVGPGALVPRPETELLAEWALGFLDQQHPANRQTIVDVGTGPGTIALAIASERRHQGDRIVGSDASLDALAWARVNRQALGLDDRVHLVAGNLLDWFGGQASLIVANLPYLRTDQIDGNWDLSAEPRVALEGGRDGLALIEALLAASPRVLSRLGAIALEIDPAQSAAVHDLIRRHLPWLNPAGHPDLAGLARFVTGTPTATQ